MCFVCVGVFGLQIGVAAIVHRFSANWCCFRVVFFAFQSAVVIYCDRLLFLNCGLVWLAAVLDGGVLLRVLYRFRAMRGALMMLFAGLSVGQQGSDGVAVRADV